MASNTDNSVNILLAPLLCVLDAEGGRDQGERREHTDTASDCRLDEGWSVSEASVFFLQISWQSDASGSLQDGKWRGQHAWMFSAAPMVTASSPALQAIFNA